ncbi:hypothetical protein FB451DRAFT_1498347 [Mycena latifolia]|nr:hypothetical protein FB451DRAFT_1498347 [Mycena latifolia]
MLVPILPTDVERLIFEICALSWPLNIPTLMLVAWRVKVWAEPLLYRTIVQHGEVNPVIQGCPAIDLETLERVLRSKPRLFFEDFVRNLSMYHTPKDLEELILSTCSRVENLWIVTGSHSLPLISTLPLKRLHCSLQDFFSPNPINFTLPLFSRLTHLEVLEFPKRVDRKMWSGLALIPNLTHLSFNSQEFLPLWTELLDTCKSLEVLIYLWGDSIPLALESHQDGHNLARDPRFVVMECRDFLGDWQMGVHHAVDYWSHAEDFIAMRRSGKVDALQYEIYEDESINIEYPYRR